MDYKSNIREELAQRYFNDKANTVASYILCVLGAIVFGGMFVYLTNWVINL
jgi:hypothetical protein